MTFQTPRIPLGLPDLDQQLNGGVRSGTTIASMGPFDSGFREFINSAAIMHGNWQDDSDRFQREYNEVDASVQRLSDVHFISVLKTEDQLRQQFESIADPQWAATSYENISFHAHGDKIANLGSFRIGEDDAYEIGNPADRLDDPFDEFFTAIGETFSTVFDDAVVFWDALTDLKPIIDTHSDWQDMFFILNSICHRVSNSNSVLITGLDTDLLTQREETLYRRVFDAVVSFYRLSSGFGHRHAFEIADFPAYYSANPSEDKATFEMKIDRGKYGIAGIEKIPPTETS